MDGRGMKKGRQVDRGQAGMVQRMRQCEARQVSGCVRLVGCVRGCIPIPPMGTPLLRSSGKRARGVGYLLEKRNRFWISAPIACGA
jgi:hypothetical protein